MARSTDKTRTWVLLTASLVSSLIMLDSNIVAVSLPAMARSLHASFRDVQWVISAYLIAYAALLLAAGALADLWGRKRAMVMGLVIFGAASVACGLASSSLVLNVARALQGVGGSLLLTSSLAIVTHTFSGAERGRAFAVWGAWIGVALVAGPILGGFITSLAGWRWVFLVNIPVCIGLVIATFVVVSESKDDTTRSLDVAGVLTFSPGLLLLVWALIDGNDAGWFSPSMLGRFIGAAVFFVVFGFVERRSSRPMVDFSLFRQRTFLGAFFAMLGYGASAQVMVFTLPVFLQNAYGFSPAGAGLAMLPFALLMVLAPRLVAQFGSTLLPRARLTAGLAITLLANLAYFACASSLAPYSVFVVGMVIGGAGAGVLNGETVKVMGSAVPAERAGMASGLASTTRFIGILVGGAVLGAILSARLGTRMVEAAGMLGADSKNASIAARLIAAGNSEGALALFPASMRPALHDAGVHGLARGFASGTLVSAVLAAIACVLTFYLVGAGEPVGDLVPVAEGHCQLVDCRHPI
jgi:EmrB/QacA subfamily drug resistance transporter